MLKFLILLSAVACALGASIPEGMPPQLDGRIVGGEATTINSFPYQVSLQRYGRHICGGALIAANKILTAAHCVQASASSMQVRAGSTYSTSGGIVARVARCTPHKDYNANTKQNDIAVCVLTTSLPLGPTIQIIEMASIVPANNAPCVVSGWGVEKFGALTSPTMLRKALLNLLLPDNCKKLPFYYFTRIKTGMICAYANGKDACQGDSGGPLVCNGILVGVVSWGEECALNTYPGVYASVQYYRSWVLQIAGSM